MPVGKLTSTESLRSYEKRYDDDGEFEKTINRHRRLLVTGAAVTHITNVANLKT